MPHDSTAPGAPGIKAKWTSSSKSGIGKALNSASQVAFTLSHGIINEVYFPREDIACIRDMGMLVTNGKDFFSEEKRDCTHEEKMVENGIPAYFIKNTCLEKRFEITKEIIADPFRNSVVQKTNFKVTKKNEQENYHLYVLLAPHLNDQGNNNSAWLGEYKGIPMLYAKSKDFCVALACSSKWLKRSAGFVGHSDGWNDLQKHKEMRWQYSQAEEGNVALTGEIDISENSKCILSLGFGKNIEEASNHAWGSILDGFDFLKQSYIDGWKQWLLELKHLAAKNYRISATVMRMHEARTFPGGIIASLSIPWGETKGDKEIGGYHVVWPRDLVESAGGFLALQAYNDTLRVVNYLMSTQKADGSWPQNMWLEGIPHWKGLQMDQTAFPVLIADRCVREKIIDKERLKRYWPGLKKAIAFLLINAPYTEQDRWEEQQGFSPFTISVCIAAMLAGADLAEINNEKALAKYCRERADEWNESIEKWTYITGTALARKANVDGYYIRLNPYYNIPAQELGSTFIDLKNHKDDEGKTLLSELVSTDALALVRFGLRAADDPKILNTIKVIDEVLKVETPNGPCWHRYNNDGYGEHADGEAYDGSGIGRAWPLLTGERAHYEVAAGNIAGAKILLKAMDAFACNGFLSEQIWDMDDIPEKELFFGQHSGSAMPLTWAHAEYVKLCASIGEKKVFDMPKQTQERYIHKKNKAHYATWNFNYQFESIKRNKKLRIQLTANADIYWTDNDWKTKHVSTTKEIALHLFSADISFNKISTKEIQFTFFWKDADKWENKTFAVNIDKDKNN